MNLAQRIHRRCHLDGECMVWLGCTNNNGLPRGNCREAGSYDPRRVLWVDSGRTLIKNGVFLRPLCDNELCIAPAHQDHRSRKQASKWVWKMNTGIHHRIVTTESNRKRANVKLTMEIARAMRARYAECANAAQVAREFGVKHDHAHKVCRNRAWKEVNPWTI